MSIIILDSNVVSEFMVTPNQQVQEWFKSIMAEDLRLTSITHHEVLFGLNRLPDGKKKSMLSLAYKNLSQLIPFLSFDDDCAFESARIGAKLQEEGNTITDNDLLIGGIVSAHNATLATRNIRHYKNMGITLVNPWKM